MKLRACSVAMILFCSGNSYDLTWMEEFASELRKVLETGV
jgi:hypothetical protein